MTTVCYLNMAFQRPLMIVWLSTKLCYKMAIRRKRSLWAVIHMVRLWRGLF